MVSHKEATLYLQGKELYAMEAALEEPHREIARILNEAPYLGEKQIRMLRNPIDQWCDMIAVVEEMMRV